MSSSSSAPQRKSRGRQKVKMAKMENHSNLQVTFSKRRAGLFKKASELCTLCGADAAIVVFSPANKAYCFGHPSVKAVVDRLSAGMDPPPPDPRSHLIIEAHRNSNIRELNVELTRLESLLRAERRQAEEIEAVRRAGQQQRWLPTSIDDLGLDELAALKEAVVGFKKDFEAEVQKQMFRVRVAADNLDGINNNINNPNPGGFSLPSHGVDFPRLSLGFGDLSSYNYNLSGDYSTITTNSGGGGGGYYGWSDGGVLNVGGGSNGAPSSSMVPHHHPHTSIGDLDTGLFQMF